MSDGATKNDMNDVTCLSVIELRDAIASGKTTAVEATRAYLDRIEKLNPVLHAYREVYADRAMETAAVIDRRDTPAASGPLAGVPIAIKDNLCTDWGHTTCSSKMLEGFAAPYTGTAVAKLEAAGAIILGKTNLDEFAMGSSTENSAFETTLNPWDTSRVPGGSSGGSAAALAGRLCAASIGSDTGGSIRQPAALCGVVGFKPTYGRISRWGLVAFASSLDQIGPFSRSVADTALLTAVMSGRDPRDSTSADIDAMPTDASAIATITDPSKLRIGVAKEYASDGNDPAVVAAVTRATEHFKSLGATIVDVELPHTEYGIPTYYIVATAEASSNLARYDGVHYGHRTSAPIDDMVDLYSVSRAEGFGDEVKRRIMLGTYALSSGYYDAYYLRALKVRRLIKNDFDKAFDKSDPATGCDAILCPTTTAPAFEIGAKSDDPLAMYMNDVYTVNCNLAGIPGISVPAGTTSVGDGFDSPLPVGVQLLGPAFCEPELFGIASLLEDAFGRTVLDEVVEKRK